MACEFDCQEPGGLLRPVSASGVPARRPVCHGPDGGQRTWARPWSGRAGGQGFSLFPQIWEGVLCQRLQDDREQAGLLHMMSSSDGRYVRSVRALSFKKKKKKTLSSQMTKERKSSWLNSEEVPAEVSLSDFVATWRILRRPSPMLHLAYTEWRGWWSGTAPAEWKNNKTGNSTLCDWLKGSISAFMSHRDESFVLLRASKWLTESCCQWKYGACTVCYSTLVFCFFLKSVLHLYGFLETPALILNFLLNTEMHKAEISVYMFLYSAATHF